MHIFVDESGSFIPLNGERPRVSCLGALVVPDTHLDTLFREWRELSNRLRPDSDEVKGSELSEAEVCAVIALLKRHDVLFEMCAIDAGQHYVGDVAEFQANQADKIVAGLPEDMPDNELAQEVRGLSEVARRLSPQEFIQSFATIRFLREVLPIAINYYAQRRPRELERFHWVIDAKDEKRVRLEEFWTKLILPALQRSSETEPIPTFPFGDYSFFERHAMSAADVPELNLPADAPLLNSRQIFQEDLRFEDSKSNEGLQLVDILTNAAARLLNGKLDTRCAESLGQLMIRRSPSPLRMIALQSARYPNGTPVLTQYQEVSKRVYNSSRAMIAKRYSHIVRRAAEGTKPDSGSRT